MDEFEEKSLWVKGRLGGGLGGGIFEGEQRIAAKPF